MDQNERLEVIHGDCLSVMAGMEPNSVDAIVTDPPYGLEFMGKEWDHGVPGVHFWTEAERILKPGGYLLAFGGTRSHHRIWAAIEDAGFEIRNTIMWVYGSGFPKSHNLKGEWQGFGTALKPAYEPICVARKPLDGTVAENVLKWGVGAMDIDGCRISTGDNLKGGAHSGGYRARPEYSSTDSAEGAIALSRLRSGVGEYRQPSGRWPANLIHDGSEEVVGLFPDSQSGANPSRRGGLGYHGGNGQDECDAPRGAEAGSAARFFYCAKASRKEREAGCEGIPIDEKEFRWNKAGEWTNDTTKARNHHPTVKPLALMEYLVRLITRQGHTVLDPFAGSGTTGIACANLGREFIGIEKEAEYCEIAERRIGRLLKEAR